MANNNFLEESPNTFFQEDEAYESKVSQNFFSGESNSRRGPNQSFSPL